MKNRRKNGTKTGYKMEEKKGTTCKKDPYYTPISDLNFRIDM